MTERTAIVFGTGITAEKVANYLPSNYKVVDADETGADGDSVIIAGTDNAGWTLDGYVIPRLASGLMFANETTEFVPTHRSIADGSEVMRLAESPLFIIAVNEDGEQMTLAAEEWETV